MGVRTIVSVVKTVTNTALELLEFKDVTIDPDVEKEITELKEAHPNLSVIHGGLGGYVKPKPRPEPLSRLRKHLEEHNIKMIDVFRKFDPENNTTVSEPSFREAIKFLGLKLLESEVQKLMKLCHEGSDTANLHYEKLLEAASTDTLTDQSNT